MTNVTAQLAKKRKVTVSRLVERLRLKGLVLEVLEQHEDMVLSAIAKLRDVEGAKTIDHEAFWNDTD